MMQKTCMTASRLGQLDNQARLASQDSLDSLNSQAQAVRSVMPIKTDSEINLDI